MFSFLLDECVSAHVAFTAQRWNARGQLPALDVISVGEPADLPKGTPDPDILRWAEREGRVVVTVDDTTTSGHLADHLAAGYRSPGVLCVRPGVSPAALVYELAVITAAGSPGDFIDSIVWVPL
jgi:hypothetical protein